MHNFFVDRFSDLSNETAFGVAKRKWDNDESKHVDQQVWIALRFPAICT